MNQENQPTPGAPCEADLIERAQRGEERAFEALYNAHKRRVYRLCLRMVGSTDEAEDLTQEAFMRLFRKIHTFRGESAFSTWLHRLTVNIVLMRLRRKTVKEIPMENGDENENLKLPPREFGASDPMLTGLVDRVSLELAVAKLPQGCRQVFMFHDVLGHEHHEIAEILGCSVGNSKSQLHKARMRLCKLLGTGSRKNARRRKTSGMARSAQFLGESQPPFDGSPTAFPGFVAVVEGKL